MLRNTFGIWGKYWELKGNIVGTHWEPYHWVGPLFAIRVSCLRLSIIWTFTSCLPRQHDRKLWVIIWCNTLHEKFCWPIFSSFRKQELNQIMEECLSFLVQEEPGVGPMQQDVWKQLICSLFVCWCSFYMQLWSLISTSSQLQILHPFFFSSLHSYECIPPTFQILNSVKNNKWIKSSKTWKILWLPITTLIAHSKMEIFHFLSKFQFLFFLPKYFLNIF